MLDGQVEHRERDRLDAVEVFLEDHAGLLTAHRLADLSGDVVLGALVARVGEDLLGLVELDQAAERLSSSLTSTVKKAVLSLTRARPAACCG